MFKNSVNTLYFVHHSKSFGSLTYIFFEGLKCFYRNCLAFVKKNILEGSLQTTLKGSLQTILLWASSFLYQKGSLQTILKGSLQTTLQGSLQTILYIKELGFHFLYQKGSLQTILGGSLQTILEGSLQTWDVIDGPGCMYIKIQTSFTCSKWNMDEIFGLKLHFFLKSFP